MQLGVNIQQVSLMGLTQALNTVADEGNGVLQPQQQPVVWIHTELALDLQAWEVNTLVQELEQVKAKLASWIQTIHDVAHNG